MGRPKALVEVDGEPLVRRAARSLADGGCTPVVVVLGAAAEDVAALLPPAIHTVAADGWREGMAASLREGLGALAALDPVPDAALVHLVDLPGVTAAVVARLGALSTPDVLARACYAGYPAHPVLIGRSHWRDVVAGATGDAGARRFLGGRPDVRLVECGDVGEPDDVDTPEQLARFRARPLA